MITPDQIRAARGLLNWNQNDLARESHISLASINNIERNIGSPRLDTLRTIEHTFQSAGIEFIGQEGVKKLTEFFSVTEYRGERFIHDWMDDFVSCMNSPDDIMRVCGLDERKFPTLAPDQALRYEEHQKNTGFVEKILIEDGDTFITTDPKCYRWISSTLLGTVPYLVYKDRFVLANYEAKRITVIRNRSTAETFTRQFEFLWDMGKPIPKTTANKLADPAYREKLKKTKPKK